MFSFDSLAYVTLCNIGGNLPFYPVPPESFLQVLIHPGVDLLVTEMLGSLERSGLQIHLVFDADVYFLMMVVGVVLPPWHGGLQMFLD